MDLTRALLQDTISFDRTKNWFNYGPVRELLAFILDDGEFDKLNTVPVHIRNQSFFVSMSTYDRISGSQIVKVVPDTSTDEIVTAIMNVL